MDFEFLAYVSWREVLLAVVVLLVLYILLSFLRMSRLKNATMRNNDLPSREARHAVAAYAAAQDPAPAEERQRTGEEPVHATQGDPAWNEPPAEAAALSRVDTLDQEVALLRREIGGLRGELQQLREECRRELARPHVLQNASPAYGDAMQLAMQGQESASISQLCGISRAEADLVVALATRRETPNDYKGMEE